jgi:hypothetical protein
MLAYTHHRAKADAYARAGDVKRALGHLDRAVLHAQSFGFEPVVARGGLTAAAAAAAYVTYADRKRRAPRRGPRAAPPPPSPPRGPRAAPPPPFDPAPYLAELGLAADKAPTRDELRSAFKTAALRSHPDKGGDKESFGRVQDVYVRLMSHYGFSSAQRFGAARRAR